MKNHKSKVKSVSKEKFYGNKKKQKKSETPKRLDLRGILLRIYPNKEQASFIRQYGGCSRLLYNSGLHLKLDAIEQKTLEQFFEYEMAYEFQGQPIPDKQEMPSIKYGIGLGDFGKLLTSMKHTEKYAFLQDYNVNILQQAFIDLNQAWNNHYKYPWHFDEPTYKKKSRHKDSFRVPIRAIPGGQAKTGPKCVCGNRITICTGLENIHFKCSRRDEIFLNKNQSKIKSITVTIDNTGYYYASVLISDEPLFAEANDKMFSFDLGLKEFLIAKKARFITDDMGYIVICDDYDVLAEENKLESEHYVHEENQRFLNEEENKLKHHQRLLARKTCGSNRYEKQRKTLAKAMRKPANRRKDHHHKLSSKIVNENQVISMETLNVAGMSANHNLAKAVLDAGWGQFTQMIEYKSLKYGRTVIKNDTFFPSSKTCSNCGARYGGLKLSEREWTCPVCGARHHRDRNAANEIEQNGVKMYNERIS